MPVEVIGAGWGRTGTTSFKKALEILGYDPTYHMSENFKHRDSQFWIRVYTNDKYDFDEVFDRPNSKYTATCDFPSAFYWEEQLKKYPDAKVILTKRNAEKWYKSCCSTIFCMAPNSPFCPLGVKIMLWLGLPAAYFYRLSNLMFDVSMQGDYSKENAIQAYNTFNQQVIDRCPPKNLLVFDVAEGWEPLCAFLDKPIPNVIFPNENDTPQFRRIVNGMNLAGHAVLFVSCSVLIGVVGYAYQKYLK